MIDAVFQRATRAIEQALALAFVAAVCLNFANVIGRYAFGRSILVADEIQIYIMVCMAFLGAAVVSWRNMHLRMDALVQFFPGRARTSLQAIELALVALLAGFVLVQSTNYAWQMFVLERRSDNAGIPMWIPHGIVGAGFGLIMLIALWRGIQLARGKRQPMAAGKSQGRGAN